jgi:hypothetical protein
MTTKISKKFGVIPAAIAGCVLATSVTASTLTLDDAILFETGNDPFGGNSGGYLEIGGYNSPSLAKCDEGTGEETVSTDCDSWEDGVALGDYSEAFELMYTSDLSFSWSFDETAVLGIDMEDVLYPKFVAVKSGIKGEQGNGYYVFDITGHLFGSVSVADTASKESMFESISHVSFYDTGDTNVVPLPAAGWLLIGGLGGLVAMKRRRRAS